jgi:hypothetical protein
MATYTESLGFNKGSAGFPAVGLTKLNRIEIELDFPAITAARAAGGATALASGDVLEVMPLRAKTLVMHVGLEVVSGGTTGLTLDVGDGADADGYLDGVAGDAAGSFASVATVAGDPGALVGLSAGKYYTAADTIDVKLVGQVPGNLVCRLWAIVADAS